MMNNVLVASSLIRCVRSDAKAAPLFELIDRELGLWVLELEFPMMLSFAAWQVQVTKFLKGRKRELKRLEDSEDYCLHVTADLRPNGDPLFLNAAFLQSLAGIGCNLEVYSVDISSCER